MSYEKDWRNPAEYYRWPQRPNDSKLTVRKGGVARGARGPTPQKFGLRFAESQASIYRDILSVLNGGYVTNTWMSRQEILEGLPQNSTGQRGEILSSDNPERLLATITAIKTLLSRQFYAYHQGVNQFLIDYYPGGADYQGEKADFCYSPYALSMVPENVLGNLMLTNAGNEVYEQCRRARSQPTSMITGAQLPLGVLSRSARQL